MLQTSHIKIIFTLGLLVSAFQADGQRQPDTVQHTTRNIAWFVPSEISRINGLCIGVMNSPEEYSQTINGLSVELLGAGYALPFILAAPDDDGYLTGSHHKLKHNGIVIGPTLFSGQVNGLSVSGPIGANYDLNGASISIINLTFFDANGFMAGIINMGGTVNGIQAGFFNWSAEFKGCQIGAINSARNESTGLQLGLINFARTYRGFQIGLWNKNEKRSLPFINWQFLKKAEPAP